MKGIRKPVLLSYLANPMEDPERNRRADLSILGCGWLGMPLAKELLESGYTVKGSRRSREKLQELQDLGIDPFQVIADPDVPLFPERFFLSRTLLIDIPPGRKDPQGARAYPQRIRRILERAEEMQVKNVLLVSSTSVHPETNERIKDAPEAQSTQGNGPVLGEAEEAVKKRFPGTSTIVRFGGLIGPERHPVRYLSGRQSSRSGRAPVNMIHQKDAVGAISRILERKLWGYTFDICAPEHPTRQNFYEKAAEKAGIPPPAFDPEAPLSYKIIDPDLFVEKSDHRFAYPDPLDMPVE